MNNKCNLCGNNCNVDRINKVGFCKIKNNIRVSYFHLHKYEEPIISGSNGSGCVFFSGCNLKCIFCQNKKISIDNYGLDISVNKLQDIYFKLKSMGACNINLVSPTIYVPEIIESLSIKNKLNIPIVYNTSSYENIDTIKMLDGYVDIYLADFKYFNDDIAFKYSKVKNYRKVAINAINEMFKQVGKYKIENGLMKKGLIVRVLVLPGHIQDSKDIIDYLYKKYKDNIIISIMNQYTPPNYKLEYNNLNRKLLKKEYNSVIDYALNIGVKKLYIQEDGTQSDSFIPNFDINVLDF